MIFYYIFIFLFGISIGSFLNVLICRLEESENPNYRSSTSIVGGRSYCPHCRHQIRWYDNIPLFSFFILAGKCRDCRGKISWQYPLIELAMGLLFLIIFNFLRQPADSIINFQTVCFGFDFFQVSCFKFHVSLLYLFIVFSGLFAILVYDFKHYIIPNKILYPLIVLALGFGVFNLFQVSMPTGRQASFSPQSFVFSLLIPLFFLSLIIISRGKWMGMGDVKLSFFMALFLSWPNIIVAIFLAFWLGTLVSLPLLIFGKKGLKSQIPFGPFLITGTFIAFFWGERIIVWYLQIAF